MKTRHFISIFMLLIVFVMFAAVLFFEMPAITLYISLAIVSGYDGIVFLIDSREQSALKKMYYERLKNENLTK